MMLLAFTLSLLAQADAGIQSWMQDAFYPVLLGVLVVASLGIPIPEDIPLIAAGVLLRTHPGIATWPGTFGVAIVGIMFGDLVLYSVGRFGGPGVLNHRLVRKILTRRRFLGLSRQFHKHGVWMVFFGRLLVGVRAAMCVTAGATRYPYPRFFLADFAGALLSVPVFVLLGYWFAGMLPTLRAYLANIQMGIGILIVLALAAAIIWFLVRRRRQARLALTLKHQVTATAVPRGVEPPSGAVGDLEPPTSPAPCGTPPP